MVTIFTFPRPFKEPFLNAQKNAINSWKKIHPDVEIYLINDEENSSKAFAKKNGIKCIDGKFSEFGTPLLKDALEKIKQLAKHKDILFFNTDIIYIDGMLKSINKIHDSYEEYFVVGRRVNIDLDQKIDFNNKNYKSTLVDLYNKGDMHGLSGLDYWLFSKNLFEDIPNFRIGKPGYDSWLLANAHKKQIPTIDASKAIRILHQNHDYPQKKSKSYTIEYDINIKLLEGDSFSLRNCTLQIDESYQIKPASLFHRTFNYLNQFFIFKAILNFTRRIRDYSFKNAKK
tara:strand:+ start:9911 stop:10768 length:858 start_codon:yes stop_codon:yes gene_type:complete